MPASKPRWYQDAIIYELHVRAFYDSVGEGAGEFRGLAQKLDYLQDLGINAVWLLPFYPSPLRDDGYDIADYTSIHPDYGNLEGFQEFLEAAHARGLRVITELVINHTSDRHPWFQRARRAPPGSPERDFYVWSESPDRYAEARIIFKDFETSNWTWDKVANAYYWHRFYSHQPDLNFDNREVWNAIFPVVDFWFAMGVDGLRLDAVPYLFEREGTNCENLPETHGFLKALRKHVDETFPDRMLLAEANQWPEDAVAYFGDGDECHMAFHFPVMPRLFMAMHMEDRLPIVDIMEQTPDPPEGCQWALFLRNHDELTLEMVTDEERDYMYRAYASDPRARINLGIRHRLAPLLGNNRRRIELMNGLLFSLPGTPVIYYGDEIGMGDNIYLGDRNGVRTPMQWSADRNAGFSRANPQKLYLPVIIDPEYHYEAVNVEAQQSNQSSLLWWNKRLIALRRRHAAFSRGRLEFLRPLNRHVLAFLRIYHDETVLIIANLSRFVQHAELDLDAFEDVVPIELLGGSPMPKVRKGGYSVMLGPHSFYWLMLPKVIPKETVPEKTQTPPAMVRMTMGWSNLLIDPARELLEEPLTDYIAGSARFRRSDAAIRRVAFRDIVRLEYEEQNYYLALVDLEMVGASSELSWIVLGFVPKQDASSSVQADPPAQGLIAELYGGTAGWLVDALFTESLDRGLLEFIMLQRRVRGNDSLELRGVRNTNEAALSQEMISELPVCAISNANTLVSLSFGDRCVVKPISRLEEATGPETELGRWLSERRRFPHVATWLGSLEMRFRHDRPLTLAVVYDYIRNEGDGWQFTLDELAVFFDRVVALSEGDKGLPQLTEEMIRNPNEHLAPAILESLGGYLDPLRLMASHVAELHLTTSSEENDPAFAPEEFSTQYQRSLYQSFRNHTSQALYEFKRASLDTTILPGSLQAILSSKDALYARYHHLIQRRVNAWRVRIHGNLHLGQLLRSGKRFVFVDFDGGPYSVTERRIKRSPIRDVAGMVHSLDYAAFNALMGTSNRRGRSVGAVRSEDYEQLARWSEFWRMLVRGVFISTYRDRVSGHPHLDIVREDFDLLLDVFLLDLCMTELRRNIWERTDSLHASFETLRHYLNSTGAVPQEVPYVRLP